MLRNIIIIITIIITTLCATVFHVQLYKSLFFSGHEHDVKSLQGENLAGAISGGDDETETETEAPENQNIIGPSTNSTTVLPRYCCK